ncbi:MAG: ASPIC/UnbV domain-containing protein, partial [Acidobacteriota bacterium]
KSATGYCSQNQLPVIFGLGPNEPAQVDRVEIVWPSGKKQELRRLAARKVHTVTEPE